MYSSQSDSFMGFHIQIILKFFRHMSLNCLGMNVTFRDEQMWWLMKIMKDFNLYEILSLLKIFFNFSCSVGLSWFFCLFVFVFSGRS